MVIPTVPAVNGDETAPPTRGDRYGEAFPTATSLDVGQDRENIPKTSTMPHESFPRVTSLVVMRVVRNQKLSELMELCNHHCKAEQTQMDEKIHSQETLNQAIEGQDPEFGGCSKAKRRFSRGCSKQGRNRSRGASGGLKEVFTTASPQVPLVSSNVSTAKVLTTAIDTTPYRRRPRASREVVIRSTSPIPISIPSTRKEDKRKGKEIMTELEKPAKAKVQEQMSLQLARELQEEYFLKYQA
ncbi:hypothetical protein Tco_1293838 [Tanacetum coccineum]